MSDFLHLANALETELHAYYARNQEPVGPSTRLTIDTNSHLVEGRGAPLVAMLSRYGAPGTHGAQLLDLGCGFGALSVYFGFLGADVTGIDPNAGRMEVGQKVATAAGLAVQLKRGRMERLRFADESFDLVVANNSLCYLVDRTARRRAFAEVRRVLRPGGVLICRNPNRWNPIDQFTGLPLIHLLPPRAAVRLANRLGRKRSECRLVSPAEAARELRSATFTDIVRPGFVTGAKPDTLTLVARYLHVVARRPDAPAP